MHTLRQLRSKNKAKHIAAAIRKTIKAVFVKELQAEIKNNETGQAEKCLLELMIEVGDLSEVQIRATCTYRVVKSN